LLRVQSQQLPTESQVLEDEVLPGTENADQPAEEMSERYDHGKNFSGKVRIELCAKSFILQVYDVLARHNSSRVQTGIWQAYLGAITLRGKRVRKPGIKINLAGVNILKPVVPLIALNSVSISYLLTHGRFSLPR
jgi:hypothetical protein